LQDKFKLVNECAVRIVYLYVARARVCVCVCVCVCVFVLFCLRYTRRKREKRQTKSTPFLLTLQLLTNLNYKQEEIQKGNCTMLVLLSKIDLNGVLLELCYTDPNNKQMQTTSPKSIDDPSKRTTQRKKTFCLTALIRTSTLHIRTTYNLWYTDHAFISIC
jgi:hypothetical protein